jgi:hypothetical protein
MVDWLVGKFDAASGLFREIARAAGAGGQARELPLPL